MRVIVIQEPLGMTKPAGASAEMVPLIVKSPFANQTKRNHKKKKEWAALRLNEIFQMKGVQKTFVKNIFPSWRMKLFKLT